MKYKIESIMHSGAFGKRKTERTEEEYINRLGKVVEVNFDNWHVGSQIWMEYDVNDPNDKHFGKYLVTSPVVKIEKKNNGDVVLETENTIYHFSKI